MATQSCQQRPDRRRNFRLRRLVDCAYGLSICLAAGQVAAAENVAPTRSAFERQVATQSPRLVILGLDYWSGSDADLQEFLRAPLKAEPELRERFLQALDDLDVEDMEFESQPLKRIKYGLAFDYMLPQGGAVHMTLYQRRNAKRKGIRLALNAVDQGGQGHQHRDWSVGLSSDFIRTEKGDRRIGMKPQLILDLDKLLDLRDWNMDAKFEYGYWQSGYKRAVTDVRVAQASLNLRF